MLELLVVITVLINQVLALVKDLTQLFLNLNLLLEFKVCLDKTDIATNNVYY